MNEGSGGVTRERSRYAGAWLVFVGGAGGTLVRYLIDAAVPRPSGIPVSIFAINVAGALLLGLLVGLITGADVPSANQLRLRLLLGTGVLGSFTTYSALAFDTAGFVVSGRWGAALAYGLATVIIGGAATVLGLGSGRRIARVRAIERAGGEPE